MLNKKVKNSYVLCSANIVFWYVCVSNLQRWWWIDVYLQKVGVSLAMDVSEDIQVVEVDIYRSHVVLRHSRYHWIL